MSAPISPRLSPTLVSDLEAGNDPSSSQNVEEDPFGLRGGLKTEADLTDLRARGRKGKRVERFHRAQNELIESLLKPMDKHTSDAAEEVQASRLAVKIAINASLIANFCLCALQVYAAISSGSLSLLTTGIDSVFDIGSNLMLYWLHRKARNLDVNKWPVGGSRVENIGNIIYGEHHLMMSSVNLIVVVESFRTVITHNPEDDLNKFHVPSIVAVGAALGVKFILFLYCLPLRNKSSQVEMLWEDHRNDLFINGFGILMSAGGSKLRWWLDPSGAIIIAAGVILAWTRTIYKEFGLLAGRSAPHEFLQLVIYKAMMFSKDFESIDTVRAYHSGPTYFVEVDVVMPRDTPLWKAHDLSQQLQDKLEVLPNVGRAFVHVDHETTHAPEHRRAPSKDNVKDADD
ncbi:CDF manganese transporter [Exidia glandulosa HHB12029]|uniref:CDF manganese transporter n=1 Tax=Exidia glandulosa HHB12029 TaxID=1314781 RepID=A0A165MPE9_EXIGL|nr:CDF manganese transporter [Exidia glandulosa HHB12029]